MAYSYIQVIKTSVLFTVFVSLDKHQHYKTQPHKLVGSHGYFVCIPRLVSTKLIAFSGLSISFILSLFSDQSGLIFCFLTGDLTTKEKLKVAFILALVTLWVSSILCFLDVSVWILFNLSVSFLFSTTI